MDLVLGLGLLFGILVLFSVFSLKAPKGQVAMSGLADAAVASFLVEAIHFYIMGNSLNIAFLGEVGAVSGGMGGVAACAMVALHMGVSPVLALSAAIACGGQGILPGFIAGYAIGFIAPICEKKLPEGVNVIFGALFCSAVARLIAVTVAPGVTAALAFIGNAITVAAEQQPVVMGILLGGIMKIVCTAPLSSMALTAMLGVTGLPMGIAAIACVGGAISNGVVLGKMGYGNRGNVIAVMLEPLTQAVIVTSHPLPIYTGSFVGGACGGLAAALLGVINNAPGTASPIPGLLAPLAFNAPGKVFLAAGIGIVGGFFGGLAVSAFYKALEKRTGKAL